MTVYQSNTPASKENTAILSLKSITKRYGERVVINDLSLDIPERGIVAISGESGVGKTTLLRIICGLDKNFDGEIQKNGDIRFGFVFQEYRLLENLTALSNVTELAFAKPTAQDTEKAKKMLAELGFSQAQMAQHPRELSGGMKQRVSLARAFVSDADILLLDEPTKELDKALVDTVLRLIERESTVRPIILVTHRESDLSALEHRIVKRIDLQK